ncbi:hypothetical protein [Aliikangiella coralliicola]|uniref:VWA domain-containing protein n=1 Tax=Aliikangiella coralliicola TaxID=2592383 RepID=A0A545UEW0_9GAMM|nr:hypothetical protein [Aliikangiella coralliicola]TQV88009.1 hypothetical protein FLL46_09355 [Aliikangiella coralliicola]
MSQLSKIKTQKQEINISQIEGEDLVLFINACFTCTGQREFYEDAHQQDLSIEFLHQYILGNYRRLYALTLATGINHYNQALIIFNLLSAGVPKHSSHKLEESNLIRICLSEMPVNRVLKLFALLKKERVNNRRTRAVVKSYLNARKDPGFDAVKYRTKIKQALTHVHEKVEGERARFLFDSTEAKSIPFETSIFDSFQRAKYSKQAVYELPFTVAESFAERHSIPRDVFLKGIEGQLTKNEKLRLQKAAAREKQVKIDVDFGKLDLTRLVLYWLSLGYEKQVEMKDKFEMALETQAESLLKGTQVTKDKIALVVDRSFSMWGSKEKKRRPLAIGFAVHQILKRAAKMYNVFWSSPLKQDLHLQPKGQSNIAEPFIEALKKEPDMVLIISDGFENDPVGLTSHIYQSWLKIQKGKANTSIVHLNPVYDANSFNVKGLGGGITSVGIRNAEDIAITLEYCRFADGRATIDFLENYVYQKYMEKLANG